MVKSGNDEALEKLQAAVDAALAAGIPGHTVRQMIAVQTPEIDRAADLHDERHTHCRRADETDGPKILKYLDCGLPFYDIGPLPPGLITVSNAAAWKEIPSGRIRWWISQGITPLQARQKGDAPNGLAVIAIADLEHRINTTNGKPGGSMRKRQKRPAIY